MNKRLNILIVEDDYLDALFLNHIMVRAGLQFESRRVESESDFRNEIIANRPDFILSDHGLPSFPGTKALAIARKECPDIPFIFVTGSTETQILVKSANDGIAGCVSKSQISQLPPLIDRLAHQRESSKPASPLSHLVSRVKALFQRKPAPNPSRVTGA